MSDTITPEDLMLYRLWVQQHDNEISNPEATSPSGGSGAEDSGAAPVPTRKVPPIRLTGSEALQDNDTTNQEVEPQ